MQYNNGTRCANCGHENMNPHQIQLILMKMVDDGDAIIAGHRDGHPVYELTRQGYMKAQFAIHDSLGETGHA